MQLTLPAILLLLLIGLAAGSLSGLVGIGGGIIIVPALMFAFSLDQKAAQGTSLAVLSLPVVALGAYQYYLKGVEQGRENIHFAFALVIAVGFVIGGLFGGKLANALPTATVQKIFAVLLIVMGVKLLFFGK